LFLSADDENFRNRREGAVSVGLSRQVRREVTYCRETPVRNARRLQRGVLQATSSTGLERAFLAPPAHFDAKRCDEIAQFEEGALARLSQGSDRDADAENLESLFSKGDGEDRRAVVRDYLKGVKR
jgi:hypothetical protein